jgi:hypothetical protein
MYLRLKTIKGRKYVYLVESRRVGGKVQQRSLTCFGALDGAGRSVPATFSPGAAPLSGGAAVEFKLLIQGSYRLLRGMVIDAPVLESGGTAPIIRYPLLGELREVQVPWAQVAACDRAPSLPLAGHGLDPSRLQTVLPV